MTNDAAASSAPDWTEDAVLGGRLILRQPRRGHRAGHDALLLAAATQANPTDRVVEFGAGVGTAGLAVARRVSELDLTLVERDPALVRLAQDNAALNGLEARVIELDIGAPASVFETVGLAPDSADVILMNPPFHGAGRHRASPDAARRAAHIDPGDTLEVWIHAARRLLASGGRLSLIWRADDLPAVTAALSRGFGAVEIFPVYSAADSAAIRILVRAIKGSRGPLQLFRGIVLNDRAGCPTAEANAVLTGADLGSALALAAD